MSLHQEEKVLITGITGYLGSAILDQLYGKGFKIVGTYRSDDKARYLKSKYPDILDLIQVPQTAKSKCFQRVFDTHNDIDYVIHCQTPALCLPKDGMKEVIEPAVNGTLSVLNSAHHSGRVKRIVQASSIAALFHHSKFEYGITINENSWNSIDLTEGMSGIAAYFASRAFAEKTAWVFSDREKPKFDVVSLCFPTLHGPQIIEPDSLQSVVLNNEMFCQLIDSSSPLTKTPYNCYLDVRDAALFALIPIINPSQIPGNTRWFPVSDYYSIQQFADAARYHLPTQYASRINPGKPDSKVTDGFIKFENQKTNRYFRIQYKPLFETASDTIRQLIDAKGRAPHVQSCGFWANNYEQLRFAR